MSPKELKKLRRNLRETEARVQDQLGEAWKFVSEVEKSAEAIRKLRNRVNYYIGKAKGMKCPVFQSDNQWDAKCRANGYGWGGWRNLFPSHCANCKLSKEQAKRKALFREVFKKSDEHW